jgi:hypothetical protein
MQVPPRDACKLSAVAAGIFTLCVTAKALPLSTAVPAIPLTGATHATDRSLWNQSSSAATANTTQQTPPVDGIDASGIAEARKLIGALQCMVDDLEGWKRYHRWERSAHASTSELSYLVERHDTVSKALPVMRYLSQTRLAAAGMLGQSVVRPSLEDRMIWHLQSWVDELEQGPLHQFRMYANISTTIPGADRESCASACRCRANCRGYVHTPDRTAALGCCRLLRDGGSWELVSASTDRDALLGIFERDGAYSAWLVHCSKPTITVYKPILKVHFQL